MEGELNKQSVYTAIRKIADHNIDYFKTDTEKYVRKREDLNNLSACTSVCHIMRYLYVCVVFLPGAPRYPFQSAQSASNSLVRWHLSHSSPIC